MKNTLPFLSDKEIEKKLARLAAFTELNPRPVIEIDFKGNILDSNLSANEFFPTLKKMGAKHPYLSDLQKIVKSLKKEKIPFRREIKIKNKWFKQIFYYIPDFNLIHVYASDVTERKWAEENLKESEKRYHLLFEKMNYGYALQDIIFDEHKRPIDFRFIDVNPAFEKLSKLKKDHIIGKTANEIAVTPPTKESIKLRKEYAKVALTGKPMYFESYNEKAKKYFELYAYKPNKNQIALIFSDITHRKKTDEEKNNFISIMSHELRNPLTPIMANAQFINLLLQKEKSANPAIKESINVIEKQSKIMADLLNDILDVSRLSRQRIQLKKSKVNICEVIESSVESSAAFIATKQQKLSLSLGKNPTYIHADPLRLEQIMVNIINNASKYTQPKGHISIQCAPKNDVVEITVKDNGSGMSPEKITRIFELFSDESQPFMGIGGLGIGLNIVKNLVAMHKGSISVKSKGINKGSEFTVRLPINKQNITAKTKKPLQEKLILPHKNASRILVVDDNADIRNAISRILQSEGYDIQSTHDGLLAVEISKAFKPHIALIDIGLPGINGYKVAKMLREQHSGEPKKIKLIAITGYGQENDKRLSKEAGFDTHLTKPIDIKELIKLL